MDGGAAQFLDEIAGTASVRIADERGERGRRGMADAFWPAGKRTLVFFNVAYEAWSESHAPGLGPMGNPLPAGLLDTQALSWGAYASKRGIWRLLDILARHGTRATVFASGCLAERAPETLRVLAEAGHEIAAHGYTQDVLPVSLAEAEERADIRRCMELIGNVTGSRPSGWVSPRGTPSARTPALLAEAGFTWYGDCFDDDVPYVEQFGDRRLAAIPLTMEVNDLPIYLRHGNAPRVMLDIFQDTFRQIYNHEPRAYLDVTVHAHVFGRPAGAWVYEQILEIVNKYSDIWIATRAEVAEWLLNRQGENG